MKKIIMPACLLPFLFLLYSIIANCAGGWIKLAKESDAVVCGVSPLILSQCGIDVAISFLTAAIAATYVYAGAVCVFWLREREERKREAQRKKERESCSNL